ncbi:MAG: site-specific integrase [Coriobacteriales bacterium]
MDKQELFEYLDAYIAERRLAPRTRKGYAAALSNLIRARGGVDEALRVDAAGVDEWIRSAGVESSTLSTYFFKLARFFSFLVREDIIGRNPFEEIAPPGVERTGYQKREQRVAESDRKAAEDAAKFTAFGLLEDFSDSREHSRKTRLRYRIDLWKLADWVGGPDEVLFATAEDVGPWLEQLSDSENSRATHFNRLRAFFDYAVAREAAPENPFRGIPAPKYSHEKEWTDRLEVTDFIRMIECARSEATSMSGQMTYAMVCLAIYNGIHKKEMQLANVGDYRKSSRDGAVLIAGGRPLLLNAETERALDGFLSYRWGLQPEDPLFICLSGPRKGERFAAEEGVAYRVRSVALAAGVDLKGRHLFGSVVIEALHEGLAAGQAAELFGLSPRNLHVQAMAPEAELVAALPLQSRVELGLVTRADVTRGIATRADLAAALESDSEAELFDVVISYDGTARFEPKEAFWTEHGPTPQMLRGRSRR